MLEGETPDIIDSTESLVPSDPFTTQLREIIDREFPLVDVPGSEKGEKRREYPFMGGVLDQVAKIAVMQTNFEKQALEEEAHPIRYISLPEAAVGLTKLSGHDYKRGGRAPAIIVSTYFPGDISAEMGNAVFKLYQDIQNRDRLSAQTTTRRICGLVVGGAFGASEMDETFAKLGVKEWFDDKKVIEATQSYLTEKESKGELPEGASKWFDDFLDFAKGVTDSPFQRVLKNYGRFTNDPYSEEGVAGVKSIYESQSEFGRIDPKIEKMAQLLGVIEPPKK